MALRWGVGARYRCRWREKRTYCIPKRKLDMWMTDYKMHVQCVVSFRDRDEILGMAPIRKTKIKVFQAIINHNYIISMDIIMVQL